MPNCHEKGRSLTLTTSGNESIVGDHIGLAAISVHLIKQLQRQPPLTRLLAGTYQGAVSDDVAFTAPGHHVLKDLQRCLHLHVRKCLKTFQRLPNHG